MTFLTIGNKPLVAGGQLLRTASLGGGEVVVPPTPGAALPTSSLTGWWDTSARPIGPAYSIAAAGSTSKVAAVALGSGTPGVSPHVAGTLPGFYVAGTAGNYAIRHPVVMDYGVNATAMPVGTGSALCIALVWTRPNLRQVNAALDHNPVSLLKVGGVDVLQLSAVGTGTDTLTLFPGSTAAVAGSFPIRHTHGVTVQFSNGTVDVWLDDGTHLFTAVTSPITLGSTADVSFLSNSQTIFHEAATWSKVLTAQERTDALSYFTRWPMGKRRAANFLMIGQSNAGLFTGSYSLTFRMGAAVAYLTGCPSGNGIWGPGTVSGVTFNAGQGIYDNTSSRFLNPLGGGDPSTWPLGANGNTYMAAIDNMTADDRENTFALWWFWSETDSQMLTTAMKSQYTAAMKRVFSLIRAKLGRTPAQLPVMVINAIPYLTTEGCQIHREVMQDLVNDSTQNCRFMLTQSTDANGEADSWDPATGNETGPGDGGHRNFNGMIGYQRRMVYPLARAILDAQAANATPDVLTSVNSALPVSCGPKIVSAIYEGTTFAATGSSLITVVHDGGNDLIVPLKGAQGKGWVLMDGLNSLTAGTPGTPGTLINGIACTRISSTQIRVTWASLPNFPAKGKVYYPYGMGYEPPSNYASIGQGNAVTDNFASVVLPAGWKVGNDLGAAEQINNPVQATTYGVPLN